MELDQSGRHYQTGWSVWDNESKRWKRKLFDAEDEDGASIEETYSRTQGNQTNKNITKAVSSPNYKQKGGEEQGNTIYPDGKFTWYNPMDHYRRYSNKSTPTEDVPTEDVPTVDFDTLEKGIRGVESLNGVLMKNKQSSASGFYGDLYDEFENNGIVYDGDRTAFIADTTFQKMKAKYINQMAQSLN